MMNDNEIIELINKYNRGKATSAEKDLLNNWYFKQSSSADFNADHADFLFFKEEILRGARRRAGITAKSYKLWPRIAAALILIFGLGIATYIYFNGSTSSSTYENKFAENDIAPAKQGATLTLGNGKKILLADALSGKLAEESGIKITKTANGEVIYDFSTRPADGKEQIYTNTLTTYRGEKQQIILQDGTKVWMNAASALTYPSSFTAVKVRKVKLKGEAYFEVAKDVTHPFVVESDGQELRVLGTHFNINSYADEPLIKTTLLEGSVLLTKNGSGISAVLRPNEQGFFTANRFAISQVSTDEVVAWKNNQFIFNDESLKSIMRKVQRWYNVEVEYEPGVEDVNFVGVVSTTKNVSAVLNMMERTGKVHFKIEGRKIRILK